jgi:hypothetical protein
MAFGGLFPTSAIDVVGVYLPDFTQVFVEARPMTASVNPDTKAMEQPAETGVLITDHRIILPIDLELSLFIPASAYTSAYNEIKELFNTATLLTVQTKLDVYENMWIKAMPHVENPDSFDAIQLTLKLKQAFFIEPEFGVVPADPKKKSTVDRGNQQGSTPSPKKDSTATEWFVNPFRKKAA